MINHDRTNTNNMTYHIVWCTKYRKNIFNNKEKSDLMKQIIQEIVSSNNWTIKNMEVMPDHIHLLLSFPPKYSGSSVLKSLKGGSAKKWFEKHPEDKKILWGGNLWSKSYFISTLGNISKDVVDKYIDNQLTEYNNGKLRKDTRY